MKMDDDFQSYLVEGAVFDGQADIPCMMRFRSIAIPKALCSFVSRKRLKNKDVFLHCFIHDYRFSSLITNTKKCIEELAMFSGVICPDPTITIGGSRTINQAQIYFSRAVGFYLQKHGIFAVPCVRWGDPSTYDYCFLGVPDNYIIAVSTHGCIMPCKNDDNGLRRTFADGLPVMLERLKPKYVIVYGRMPEDIFGPYKGLTTFIHFPSDIERYFEERKEVVKNGR